MHSALVNRPFWYIEHTVVIGNEWHLTYCDVKGILGWHTQCSPERGKIIQRALYARKSVGGALKEQTFKHPVELEALTLFT